VGIRLASVKVGKHSAYVGRVSRQHGLHTSIDWGPTMRKGIMCLTLLILLSTNTRAQETSTTPQTARQALMEMLFSKTKGTFWKHLPEATRAALEKSGAIEAFHQYSAMVTQVQTGQNIQTFETGPVMVSGVDPKTGNKFEMIVERDTLRGERDEIEVSFRAYKDGQPQRTPFMPIVTFSMKKETELWTLNEASITIHLPLADPDVLKALTDKMQWKPEMHVQPILGGASLEQPRTLVAANAAASGGNSDTLVINAMRTIVSAETTYTSTYPDVGYTCTLSNLDGFGEGETGPQRAMLISSSLAAGRRYGYVFTLSGCTGTHAVKFVLTAVPNEPGFGRKVFCTDASGAIRSTDENNASSCLTSGSPIQ
jgi:type IV pilus assembly protein PilA